MCHSSFFDECATPQKMKNVPFLKKMRMTIPQFFCGIDSAFRIPHILRNYLCESGTYFRNPGFPLSLLHSLCKAGTCFFRNGTPGTPRGCPYGFESRKLSGVEIINTSKTSISRVRKRQGENMGKVGKVEKVDKVGKVGTHQGGRGGL